MQKQNRKIHSHKYRVIGVTTIVSAVRGKTEVNLTK